MDERTAHASDSGLPQESGSSPFISRMCLKASRAHTTGPLGNDTPPPALAVATLAVLATAPAATMEEHHLVITEVAEEEAVATTIRLQIGLMVVATTAG